MVSAALLPSGIGIHKKSPKTVTSYGGQQLSGQGLTGCHQSLCLCPCFFIPSPIPLASPRDAHLATRPSYYPTGTIVLLHLFLYSSSVYRWLHFLVPVALAYFRNTRPPWKETRSLRKTHKGIQKGATMTNSAIKWIPISILEQAHLGIYTYINVYYFLM